MEICLNEYVRTNDGYIGQVKDIVCKGYPIKKLEGYIVLDDEDGTILNPEEVKHSFNIIDLIEEGDIVNGQIVYKEEEGLAVERAENIMCYELIKEIKIEEILTHEQYERNCYRIN